MFAAKIARLSQSNAETVQHLDRLYYTLQASQGIAVPASTTLVAKLDCVEAALAPRIAALDEFVLRPNATAHSVVEAYIAERTSANPNAPAGPSPANNSVEGPASGAEPDSSAVYRAIALEQFRKMANTVLKEDAGTRMGRFNAIAAGFDGNCMLAVRMLCEGGRPLSLKHPALARLFDLRPHLADYFTWCLTADSTGQVPSRLSEYSIVGRHNSPNGSAAQKAGQTFLSQLLKFDLDAMDWLSSPGGLLALKAVRDGGEVAAKSTHPDDIYIIPEVVSEIGDFIHQLLVAMGAPGNNHPKGGYSFAEWTQLYVQHLTMAKKLRTLELRLQHLDRCHEYFVAALRHYGQELKMRVFCAQPDIQSFDAPLLTDQDEPVVTIKAWEKSHETALDLLHKFRGMFSHEKVAGDNRKEAELEDAWMLPRRSQRTGRSRTPADYSIERHRRQDARVHISEGSRKRPREDKEVTTPASSPMAPGSAACSHLWLSGRSELFISGRVWKIRKVAAKLKVSTGHTICWPVVLSARIGENRLAHCEHPDKAGHETLDSAAHKIAGFRAAALVEDTSLWRYATDREKDALRAQRARALDADAKDPGQRGRGAARGPARGRAHQTRGGQHFPPPSPPSVEEVTA